MSTPAAAPAVPPDGNEGLEALATDPGWLAARDRLTASLRSTSLPAYGTTARHHHAGQNHR